MPTYKELKELNDQNFSGNPTASYEALKSLETAPIQDVAIKGVDARDYGKSSLFQNISPDLVYQNQNKSVASPFASDYFNNKTWGIDFGEVTNRHKNIYGGVNPYSKAVDFEDLRRNEQGAFSSGVNLFSQYVGKTAINTIGGIIGGFYSLGAAVVNADSSLLFDNTVNRALDRGTDAIERNNTVFTSQRARDNAPLGFFSFETVKDFTDAYSFISGAVASEVILGTATGGLSLGSVPGRISKGADLLARTENRLAKAIGLNRGVQSTGNFVTRSQELGNLLSSIDPNDINRLQQVAREVGTTVEDLQKYRKSLDTFNSTVKTGRGLVTGTFWEAGLEARHTKDELYNSEIAKLEDFLNNNTSMSNEDKEIYRQNETNRIKNMSDTAGIWTFGLNTAVLGASNYVQFPTIFGKTVLSDANRMSGSLTRRGLNDYIKNGGKYTDVLKTVGRALKSPATEFTEETLQGAINIGSKSYYESMMGTRTSNGEIMPSVAGLSDAVVKGLKETYGTSEGIHEGIIGALVGAVGLPMLRKNKSGKLRPYMTGGVAESIRQLNEENQNIRQSISDLNLNEFDTLLSYNKDNAILASIDTKKEDVANLNDDKFEIDRLNDNKVFRHVKDRLDKGLESYMNDDIQELSSLSLEEYKTRFNKPDTFTEQDKTKEVSDFSNKVAIYSDAYKKVYQGLQMDRINNNYASKKLFDTLTYAVANEKIYKQRQNELTDQLLSNNNIDLNYQELTQLALLSDKFKNYQDSINDYIKSKEQDKLDKFNQKKGVVDSKINTIRSRVSEKNRGLLDEVLNKDENTIDYLTSLISLQKEFESSTYQELIADSEEIFSSVNDLNSLIEEAKLLDLNKLKETKFHDSKSSTVRELRKKSPEIIDSIKKDIEKTSSKSLEILRGKKETATQKELEDYINLKLRADEAIKNNNRSNQGSFLDTLSNSNEDIQDMLDELSNITKNQVLALDIANNLYGFDNKAYSKIVNAEFEENLFNLRNDSYYALQELLIQSDEDYMSELVANLDNSIDNINASLEEYADIISEETKKYVESEVEKANDIKTSLMKYLEMQDTKEDVAKDTAQETNRELETKAIQQIENSIKDNEQDKETIDKALNGEVLNMEFDNGTINFLNSKNLHTITPTSSSNANNIKEKIDNGTIKYNSGVISNYLESNEDTDGFNKYITDLGLNESYYRGKNKIIADPKILRNDIESLDVDVKVFITHAPVNVNIYDKEVELFEGDQEFNVNEDDTISHNFLYYAPNLEAISGQAINNINQKKDELEFNNSEELKEIEGLLKEKLLSQEEYNKQKAIIDRNFQRAINDLEISATIKANNINDKVLFSFRQSLLYNNYNNDSNELKMRLGNIINGYIEKSGDTTFEVEEYALVGDSENNNLIQDINQLQPSDILFGNQSGEYVDFNGKKVKLNRGSKINKVNALTNRLYLRYKTINNQEIPVMLNRTRLVNAPVVYDEIIHQIQEYLNNGKKPTETITLKNESLGFVKNKSYKDFFKAFMDESNSSTSNLDIDTFNINKNSKDIYFGKLDLAIDNINTFNDNKQAIIDTLSNMRYYMNSKSFRNSDDTFNRDFLEFAINNKLINHSFNTKENNDKIFLANDSLGNPFNKAIQFHILDSEPRRITEESDTELTEEQLDKIEKRLSQYNNLEALVYAFNNLTENQKNLYRDFFTNRKEDLKLKIRENLSNKNSISELVETFNKLNSEQQKVYRKYFTERKKVISANQSKPSSLDDLANNLINKFNTPQKPIPNTTEPILNDAFNSHTVTGSIADTLANALNPGFNEETTDINNDPVESFEEPADFLFSDFVLDTTKTDTTETNDYVERLNNDNEESIRINKSIIKGRINRLSNKLDTGTISKDKIKNSFDEYNANTYEKFIEMLNILYSDNSAELKKFITFANKVYNKDENNNIFNC